MTEEYEQNVVTLSSRYRACKNFIQFQTFKLIYRESMSEPKLLFYISIFNKLGKAVFDGEISSLIKWEGTPITKYLELWISKIVHARKMQTFIRWLVTTGKPTD